MRPAFDSLLALQTNKLADAGDTMVISARMFHLQRACESTTGWMRLASGLQRPDTPCRPQSQLPTPPAAIVALSTSPNPPLWSWIRAPR
ncbi:uncharacterized protein BKA78DRAFT_326511 [Phyllosticta capitalensis]|uniref:uncharacterized protein n=1 Tax=Phyllosticta capitalensis TaxID=121624 RepID=UPI00312E3C16